ncbi:MAG: VOC family protein [Methyloprofundus sp.]|nr:VOC family protein [Methyloprofundus sp.]
MINKQAMIFKHSLFYQWQTILVLLLCSTLLTACTSIKQLTGSSETLKLTPITAIPTHVYQPGKFVWHDLITPDVAAAKVFYADLFGWSFKQYGRYTLIFNKGQQIGGMVEIEPEDRENQEALWLAAISVSDVDKAAHYIKTQGGTILQGPVDMKNRGRGVLVSDPQGAQILLIRANDGDPIDTEPEIGSWLWNEIWTNAPQATQDFYLFLGEYDTPVKINDYIILENGEKWRAGIRPVLEDGFKVRWVPVVRVADPEEIVSRVTTLGGIVWLRPGEFFNNSDVALISDSTGALLLVQRWSTSINAGDL